MNISRNQLLFSFSEALDYVDSLVGSHHYDTAYITLHILKEMNYSNDDIQKIVTAALIHDIGVFSKSNFSHLRSYEFEDQSFHSETGYFLLNKVKYYSDFAEMILYHHTHYGKNMNANIPLPSHIIFLADRLSILIDKNPDNLIEHKQKLLSIISRDMGNKFHPYLMPFFENMLNSKVFWSNLENHKEVVKSSFEYDTHITTYEELKNFIVLFEKITDYKSKFTAAHSLGVSKIAFELGKQLYLPQNTLNNLEIAGMVHDIGKLAIDDRILEKPASLTAEEFEAMKSHVTYSYNILSNVNGLEKIAKFACSHHERHDGSGYPHGKVLKDLSIEEQILIISDIFTALTENRPYRKSMKKDAVLALLNDMAQDHKISVPITKVLIRNINYLYDLNSKVQKEAYREYNTFNDQVIQLHSLNKSFTHSN